MFKELFSKPKEWWLKLTGARKEIALPAKKTLSYQSRFITRKERLRRNIINTIAKKSRSYNYAHAR